MKKTVSSFIFLMNLIACFSAAHAGDNGHGAEIVVCSGKVSEIYDVYEARVLRKLALNLGAATLSYEDKISLALDRMKKFDIERPQRYEGWAKDFLKEAKIGDFDLEPLEDSKHIALPRGCTVRQLVDQREPRFTGDKRYFIDQTLWQSLDGDQKAVAILHEIIYREAILQGQKDSVITRYFNSLLISGAMSALTPLQYADIGLKYYSLNIDGIYYASYPGKFQLTGPAGPFKRSDINAGTLFSGEGFATLPKFQNFNVKGQVFQARIYDKTNQILGLYASGALGEAVPNTAVTSQLYVGGRYFDLAPNMPVIFYEDGSVFQLNSKVPVVVTADHKPLVFNQNKIQFYETGEIAVGYETRKACYHELFKRPSCSDYSVYYRLNKDGSIKDHGEIHDRRD